MHPYDSMAVKDPFERERERECECERHEQFVLNGFEWRVRKRVEFKRKKRKQTSFICILNES